LNWLSFSRSRYLLSSRETAFARFYWCSTCRMTYDLFFAAALEGTLKRPEPRVAGAFASPTMTGTLTSILYFVAVAIVGNTEWGCYGRGLKILNLLRYGFSFCLRKVFEDRGLFLEISCFIKISLFLPFRISTDLRCNLCCWWHGIYFFYGRWVILKL